MHVKTIYKQLLKKYGRQGWWPLTLPEDARGELRVHPIEAPAAPVDINSKFESGKVRGKPLHFPPLVARLAARQGESSLPAGKAGVGLYYGIPYVKLKNYKTNFRDTYFEIAVGAILTQNTTWKNVATAIINLYNAKALTPQRLLKLPTVKLQKLIRPAGYFRQKTKKLRLFSQWLVKKYKGDILKLNRYEIRDIRGKLLEQWGIGPETADSIILYALNRPIFIVDEYTRRLAKKYGIEYNEYDKYRGFFEKNLPKSAKLFKEFHALIVAWGKNNK